MSRRKVVYDTAEGWTSSDGDAAMQDSNISPVHFILGHDVSSSSISTPKPSLETGDGFDTIMRTALLCLPASISHSSHNASVELAISSHATCLDGMDQPWTGPLLQVPAMEACCSDIPELSHTQVNGTTPSLVERTTVPGTPPPLILEDDMEPLDFAVMGIYDSDNDEPDDYDDYDDPGVPDDAGRIKTWEDCGYNVHWIEIDDQINPGYSHHAWQLDCTFFTARELEPMRNQPDGRFRVKVAQILKQFMVYSADPKKRAIVSHFHGEQLSDLTEQVCAVFDPNTKELLSTTGLNDPAKLLHELPSVTENDLMMNDTVTVAPPGINVMIHRNLTDMTMANVTVRAARSGQAILQAHLISSNVWLVWAGFAKFATRMLLRIPLFPVRMGAEYVHALVASPQIQ
ncbi:hypothetical protein BJX68DRAFT_272716 [Aspergillus pseudodeflectus]|uniref:Uncharacterized protein n=1 Tax=Aspergillus pseudodeflectus TaxID=176178 RepID=A0ABR4JDV4_9EURO